MWFPSCLKTKNRAPKQIEWLPSQTNSRMDNSKSQSLHLKQIITISWICLSNYAWVKKTTTKRHMFYTTFNFYLQITRVYKYTLTDYFYKHYIIIWQTCIHIKSTKMFTKIKNNSVKRHVISQFILIHTVYNVFINERCPKSTLNVKIPFLQFNLWHFFVFLSDYQYIQIIILHVCRADFQWKILIIIYINHFCIFIKEKTYNKWYGRV
jgi:hypothetical protein